MSKEKKKPGFVKYILLVILLLLVGNSVVICHENEYKLVRQFGKVQRVISTSGLNFKIPFMDLLGAQNSLRP